MFVNINGNDLNVEVLGPDDAPVLIAHHGGGGIGSLAEPKSTFGPLADELRVVVFDARGCGLSEGTPPFSHAQWAADVDGLREWLGRRAGHRGRRLLRRVHRHGVRHRLPRPGPGDDPARHLPGPLQPGAGPTRTPATRTRVEINWDNFNRYWGGQIRDDEDLKARWAEIIPLYDFEYDAVASAARVEAGIYRHEAHNWCFSSNMPGYDLKPQLPGVRCPTLVTVGRTDWVTPVSSAETIAVADPGLAAGGLREVRPLPAVRGVRPVPGGHFASFVHEVYGARPA